MTDSLPPALKNSKLPVDAQLEALSHWLQHEKDPRPVDAYLSTFLEMQLRTARPQKAHQAACKAATGSSPRLPRGLAGAEEIEAKPYAWRNAIEIALRVAGLHARTRRELLRPLFRSLLLWPTHEREIALQALQMAQPSDAELATELPLVLAELSRIKDRPGDRLLTVIEAGFGEPRWLVALCHALQAQPPGIAALMKLEFAVLPAPADLYPASWAQDPAPLAALRAVQSLAAPMPRVLATLGLAAVPDGVSDAALIAILDDDSLPAWLREESAGWLILRNVRAPNIGSIAERLMAGQVRYHFNEKLALLKQRAAPRRVRAAVRSEKVCFIPIESQIKSGPAVAFGQAVFLLVRTLQRFPASDWRCAEEEAALGVLNTRGDLSLFPLPLRTPSHRTGAAGAERVWALECLLDDQLVISLRVPFSDERGWGTENFLLAFSTPDGFRSIERRPDGFTFHPLATPINENQLPSWGCGELLVWKDAAGQLQTYNDGTPYHLDDVDPSDEVTRMRNLAARARRGWTELQPPTTSTKKDRGLVLRGDGKTVRLSTLETFLRELAETSSEAPQIMGGVALSEGPIAVGLRSFEQSAIDSPLDAVALIYPPF